MKLLRWALAGASAYVVYKYAIGNKAQGEDVFPTPAPEEEKPKPRTGAATRKPAAPRKPKAASPKAAKAGPKTG